MNVVYEHTLSEVLQYSVVLLQCDNSPKTPVWTWFGAKPVPVSCPPNQNPNPDSGGHLIKKLRQRDGDSFEPVWTLAPSTGAGGL